MALAYCHVRQSLMLVWLSGEGSSSELSESYLSMRDCKTWLLITNVNMSQV